MAGQATNHLFDANVYLAAVVEAHVHHAQAKRWVESIEPPATMCFCRVTEMACLRLLTQRIAPGFAPLSNRDSAAIYFAWRQDPRVILVEEAFGLDAVWPRLGLRSDRSPKLWTDAYLAAMCLAGGLRFVTFDGGFRQFESEGLDLELLDGNEC